MLLDAFGCFWMLLDAFGCFWMFGNSDEYNLPSEGLQSRKYGILRRFVKMTMQLSVRHGVDFPRQRFWADQKERRRQPPAVTHTKLGVVLGLCEQVVEGFKLARFWRT